MKKKTKIILAILAVVLVFCLWYIRPRSFDKLAGDGNITYISIVAIENGPPPNSVWGVDGDEDHGDVIKEVEEILKSSKYRASLINLLPFLSAPDSSKMIDVNITLDDGSFFWAAYKGSTAVFYLDNREMIATLDGGVSQKLFDYTQEFGYRIESKT